MKIVYVGMIRRSSARGVIKKVISKIQFLSTYYDIDGLLLFDELRDLPSGIPINIRCEQTKGNSFIAIQNLVDIESYDLVIMRYPGASKGLLRFLKTFPKKVIFEHNSIEEKEKLFYLKSFSIKDYLYQLTHWKWTIIKGWIQLYHEKKIGSKCLALAKGGIGVTNEIASYERSRCKNYEIQVIANGIDVSKVPLREIPVFVSTSPLILFFSSGSANDWHGIDRLLNGIYNYQGNREIKLYIVGLYLNENQKLIDQINASRNKSIECLGLIESSQAFQLSSHCHLGIGSLGLHRIPLSEACTLKVREYCAMSLPFVLSHTDVDTAKNEKFKSFFYQIPANESAVDIEEMIDFTEKVYNQKDVRILRELCEKYMSVEVKMKEMARLLSDYAKK